jgi:Outer membrane protein beta-barrel domain
MLKKITIITALVLSSISEMMSQTLSIGPIVGLNISKFTENQASTNLAGLSVGALANYSVNEHVGLSAQLLFSQLGSNYKPANTSVRLNYLQMPISLVYYFGDAGDKFRPKIYGGPYFGRLLTAKNENQSDIVDLNNNDIFKKQDIGGQLGLGFNYLLKSRTWLNLDLGYGASFTNIGISEALKEHNSALTVKLGVSFPVGAN